MTDNELIELGFEIKYNPWMRKEVWALGSYIDKTDIGDFESPIFEWHQDTEKAYSDKLQYYKAIKTKEGLRKFMEDINSLLSPEE